MNPLYHLAEQAPRAQPLDFEFEGQRWRLFPLDTVGVAAPLERWVIQFVRANVERLQPDKDCDDPGVWQLYQEDKRAVQQAIQRGLYGAFTQGWESVVNGTDAGFAEALYLAVRFKNPNWTRSHVQRFLADQDRYAAFHKEWMSFNYPKSQAQTTAGNASEENPPTKSPSDGTGSSDAPSEN